MSIALPLLIVVSWGALAFGAVYEWAYWPLVAACVAIAIWGLVRQVPRVRSKVNRPLLVGLIVVMAAIALQLVPVRRATIVDISPATDRFLREYDLAYAMHVVFDTRAGALAENPAQAAPAPLRHPLSINPQQTLLGLAFLAGFGLFLLGLARVLDGRHLRVFVQGLAALGVVIAFAGIIQAALGNGKVYGFWQPINANARPFGPFINGNHFAGWMLMAVPLVVGYVVAQITRGIAGAKPGWRNLALWFSTPEARRAVLAGFSALVMVFALVWTASRSGVTCLLVALVLWALHILRYRGISIAKRLAFGLLMVVGLAVAGWAAMGVALVRFEDADLGLAMRQGLWRDAWRIHEMFPAFGTGFNTYGTATVLYQTYRADTLHFVEAHNDYLQILVEGGYLVAVPAAILLALFVWQVWARFREHHDDRTGHWIRLGAVTGLVTIACQEMLDFSLQIPGNAVLFIVLCAIAVRKATPKRAPEGRT